MDRTEGLRSTGYIYDDMYLRHELGRGHPESPDRLRAITRIMDESGLIKKVRCISPIADKDLIKHSIAAIHSESHIASVQDCGITGTAAFAAVGGVLSAVDQVCTAKVRNAFCALRPPGHHAHNNGAHHDGLGEGQGFCFLNNVAIGARYSQQHYGCARILILDWDYHHGNGTEWAFYEDPTVFFFSTHALFAYPGTGDPFRTGEGKGKGYNLNVLLDPYATDQDILDAWQTKLLPRLDELQFKPDLVFISAGFDSREGDTLGNFQITDAAYVKMTRIAMDIAARNCGGKLISVLEGGYNPDGLAEGVAAHVKTLAEYSPV
jgi:acetoin utilization deacetylase AcuC-like enzyme